MKEFEINPLNLIGERRVNFLPPHFKVVELSNRYAMYDLEKWVNSNLKGRYYYGHLAKLKDNKIVEYAAVAFEDPREATFFLLKNTNAGQI
jgi:hypothetical protein